MAKFERGPTKPASAARGKRKQQKSSTIVIVPTGTFEDLRNEEQDGPAAGDGGSMPEDDGCGEAGFQDDGAGRTPTRPRTRTASTAGRASSSGRASRNSRTTTKSAGRKSGRTTRR